nr:MAG TPA: hypothetical protein [Caudoviricetes sp.]
MRLFCETKQSFLYPCSRYDSAGIFVISIEVLQIQGIIEIRKTL